MFIEHKSSVSIVEETIKYNSLRKKYMVEKIQSSAGDLSAKDIAILGLSFKPETDDMRDSPSIDIIEELINLNANVFAYDPEAMHEARKIFSDKINYMPNAQDCITGKDILVVITEWNEFRALNPVEISKLMDGNIVIDLRNIYDPKSMQNANLKYFSLGKK